MASMNPHFRPEHLDAELSRCVKRLGFVGLKITPIGHAVHPSGKDAMHVYEIARGLGVAVMVHTGAGAPFAEPINVINAARAFPDVKIVLAHAGNDQFFHQALFVAQECDNVYLEPSWVCNLNLRTALKALGPGRIMFSSDAVENIVPALATFESVIDNDEVREQVYAKTAMGVFGLTW